jgi:uncharacterized Zn finger protein (UPF0148 family)
MKAMVCEMCGGNEILKRDGVYVCQHCGTRFDTDEARKLLVEGTVSVQGIETTDNLMDRAQEFLDRGDTNRALEYIDRVLDIDVRNEPAREMQRTIEGRKVARSISRLQQSKARTTL